MVGENWVISACPQRFRKKERLGQDADDPFWFLIIFPDCLELLRRLRARGNFRNVPVMVMTSSNDPNDLEECRKLKVINYVTKPITFSSFSKAVADVFHPRLPGPGSLENSVT